MARQPPGVIVGVLSPSDFTPAESVYEPAGSDLFFSLPPMGLAALALLLLLAFALGWFGRDWRRPRTGDAAETLWKALDDAAKDAMKADNGALAGKAEALAAEIDRRLGATLMLGKGLAGPLGALRKALKGERPVSAHSDGSEDHDTGRDSHAHDAHADHAAPGDHGVNERAAPAASAHATTVNINVGQGPTPPRPTPPIQTPDHPPRRPLSAEERDRALRLAVADFNEHWRRRAERIGELRRAHGELSGA